MVQFSCYKDSTKGKIIYTLIVKIYRETGMEKSSLPFFARNRIKRKTRNWEEKEGRKEKKKKEGISSARRDRNRSRKSSSAFPRALKRKKKKKKREKKGEKKRIRKRRRGRDKRDPAKLSFLG